MRTIILFFAVLPFLGYSQNDSIEILLKSDSIIYTNWLELNSNSFFKGPFIIIHYENGPKININDINYYKGFDNNGNYKECKVIDLEFQKKYHFTERIFKVEQTSNLEIFYDKITFGKWNASTSYNYLKYKINDNKISKVNYKNLKADLFKSQTSMQYLKKSNKYRISQFILTGLGSLLAAKVILDIHDSAFYAKKNNQNNLTYITAGILIVSPIVLEIPKRKNYIKALKNY
ncbi:MAG: hypothetical protein K8R31_10830 [Bacteroidales bacterium]|nr:hypothetical protein [Bacteroidales bacterium]